MPQSTSTHPSSGCQMLLNLPTEIFDHILINPALSDWRNLRATHAVFRRSVQALTYHEIESRDTRVQLLKTPTGDAEAGPSNGGSFQKISAFSRLIEAQPRIRSSVKAIKLRFGFVGVPGSDESDFVPMVLEIMTGLENVKKLTISFGDINQCDAELMTMTFRELKTE